MLRESRRQGMARWELSILPLYARAYAFGLSEQVIPEKPFDSSIGSTSARASSILLYLTRSIVNVIMANLLIGPCALA